MGVSRSRRDGGSGTETRAGPTLMSPRVWNKRDSALPRAAVYVGRPSRWGNPFSHLVGAGTFPVASRAEAVACFDIWLEQNPQMQALARVELRGRDLVCWCAPAECHAEILLKVANS